MTHRETLIVQLLKGFNEAEDPNFALSHAGSNTGFTPQMSELWNRSYRELERCLKRMRDEAPWLWWDVRERFIACQTRRVTVRTFRGKLRLPACCELVAGQASIKDKHGTQVIVREWSPLVRPERVEAGVRWISEEFRGEPFLPEEMREAS